MGLEIKSVYQKAIQIYLEPQTTISYVKIGNHPIETTIYKWLFGVPGIYT